MPKREIQIKIISLLRQLIFLYQTLLIKKLKKPPYTGERIRKLITLITQQEGVDPTLALKVAWCESRLNPQITSSVGDWSVDRGLYQWNSYYHPEISDECAYDPECACRKFCQAVKAGHLDWWNASRECWNK